MAAAGIAVSVSMGALKPVLEKLATLLGDKYKKLKGLRKEVSFLMEELSDMKVLLENMDNAEDELNSQAKKWRKDIIDMSYDIEDCIDNFMDRVGDADDKVGILKKASHYLRTIKDRYRIANQINEIKSRVMEASKRRDRYNLNVCTSGSTTIVAVDPRLTALYTDSTTLVGIGTQKEELVKWVEDEEKQLKVMSIVGFGGLGKTTLANEVYHDVEGHFNSKAFVPVSQKPDVPRLLSSVCSKLGVLQSSHACEVQELIDTLREYLCDKRYLIVLDDLWEVKHWDIISCAFPKNSQQSRLIVTTRIEGVAQACCKDHGRIHYMKPLSDADSRKLFFRRIFGTEDTCPPQFTEVSSEILKKCGGLPLAIVTMASSLADQPKEHWDYIQRSIVTESAANSLADMMQILDLSYKHLPHHLRACFLYLGIYPEDYEIERDQLIYLWVAERIVTSKSPMQDVKDVAESCFNELVNRNMIQPESYYYRVHDMMLDLIIKRCREGNFVSVVHSAQVVVERQDRVHRLSVSLSDVPDDDSIFQLATNCCRSQVRSLVFLGASKWMPPLLELKSLRVLFLQFPKHLKTMDLTGVGQLSQLRYLKVNGIFYSDTSIVLPSEIGRMRHLERLEIPYTYICSTPSDIVDLPRLSHLILPEDTSLLDGIGKMKSLRTLRSFLLAESSPEDIKGLSELNKLEDLRMSCRRSRNNREHRPKRADGDTPTAIWMDALIFSLEKLSNLKSFFLSSEFTAVKADALLLLSPPFQNLEVLYLHGLIFSRVPRWIGGLQKLCRLTLGAKQMTQEDINIIGTLPYLTGLRLRISGMPTGTIVIGGTTGFNALEFFVYDCDVMSYLAFEDGAMPSLQKLGLLLDPHKWDKVTPLGLQCLSNLKKITVWTVATSYSNDAGAGDKESEEMSAAALVRKVFQEAANAHPSHLAYTFHEGLDRPAEEAQE
ncbi:putative disease resistance RPP13-like protein 3 isoform X2 [Sorghum bicolor]|uniref:Uncharacterized protein n=2 Tax=Sorghum bicolor TaxID=4558 RepID=A0A1B6PER2_SORBI|nr:putative disease resistance RPP13-like protein 3 isoform X2 [Sorghum bicolor]XP_021320876.1 putative disease resistance RPP13-like protein 3 isoform X2 [Sorghum bicolor]KXG24190.1 hypothetical protein SORBI_3007G006200 [Sorghum bicolor]|eukprot:XP_021320875.1 putative disease resistance RPP13-like protein 3 isoform X2 [Sorghum bicolor]